MNIHREAFVGIDTAKERNAAAVAEGGREWEIRYFGGFDNTPDTMIKLVRKLSARYKALRFCYEAGRTGYGLYRQIIDFGQNCTVVVPSLIPRRPDERVKTNWHDVQMLARLLGAGELTAFGFRTKPTRRCATWCARGGWRLRTTGANASMSLPFCSGTAVAMSAA